MKSDLESHRLWLKVFGSAMLGAAAMYVLDPDKGRRRRAIASDKTRSFIAHIDNLVGIAARDVTYRMHGVGVRVRRLFDRSGVPDDLVLIERVRAKMGRVVSHPHAIQIGAHTGRVTLSGPILAGEVQQLLDVVRSVQGVFEVDDHLVAHERPESIPSLQGNSPRAGTHSQIMPKNWTPTLRVAAVLGGGVLMLYGLRRRSLTGIALASIGLGLTARGATNMPTKELAGWARGPRTSEQQTARIAAPGTAPKPANGAGVSDLLSV